MFKRVGAGSEPLSPSRPRPLSPPPRQLSRTTSSAGYGGGPPKRQRGADGEPVGPWTLDPQDGAFFTFYKYKPTEQFSLGEFEKLLMRRLCLLGRISDEDSKSGSLLEASNLAEAICEDEEYRFDSAEEDSFSHYCLRLAACTNEKWKSWMMKYESILFRARLSKLSDDQIRTMALTLNKIEARELNDEESRSVRSKMTGKFNKGRIYQVPWTTVCSLVGKRRVVLSRGMAFITSQNLKEVLDGNFKSSLKLQLAQAKTARSNLKSAEGSRLLKMADQALTSYATYQASRDEAANALPPGAVAVNSKTVDELAVTHFPPCMLNLVRHLDQDRHLKHGGRWQLEGFLKQIGMSYEQSVQYFAERMTKTQTPDTFLKSEYGYNIQHLYGLVGKKTSYTAQGCTKIIMGSGPVGGDQHHGCPFAHWSEKDIEDLFSKAPGRKTSEQIQQGKQKSVNRHFTAACHSYFHITHPGREHEEESLFSTPSAYFAAAGRASEAQKEAKGTIAVAAPAGAPRAGSA